MKFKKMDAGLDSAVLKVNEIFYSIQGESTQAGRPCVFVRLTYCNLRCSYCDTRYAYYEGQEMSVAEILDRVKAYGCPLIEITGGEPLVQEDSLLLMKFLCNRGFQVMLETNGSLEISRVDRRVKKIIDFKCPSSGETEKNRFENIQFLNPDDEVKFVVGARGDYEWARETIRKYALSKKSTVLISTVFGAVDLQKLGSWILQDHLPVRLQLQLHKIIWPAETRGV